MDDPARAREDEPLLPTEGGERRHRGEGDPTRERPWYLTFTGIVIFIIIITIPTAIVAALLGRLGFGQPQEPPTPEPIGRRIEYKELLRDVEQYLDLYRLGLPPFDVMKQQTRQFHLPLPNATVQVKTDHRPGRSKA